MLDKVDLRLCERGASGTPVSYANSISELPENSLDFILIDGKRKDSCALASLTKVKPGGMIIVDDVHRYISRPQPSFAPHTRGKMDRKASPKWEEFFEHTRTWQCVWKSDGVSDMAVWTRPHTNQSA